MVKLDAFTRFFPMQLDIISFYILYIEEDHLNHDNTKESESCYFDPEFVFFKLFFIREKHVKHRKSRNRGG